MLFPFTIVVLIFLYVFSIQGLYTVVVCYFNSGLIISHEIRLLGVGSFGGLVKNITCRTLGNPPREADPEGFSYLGVQRCSMYSVISLNAYQIDDTYLTQIWMLFPLQ